MKALIIEDLAVSRDLDGKALSAVLGGCGTCGGAAKEPWGLPKGGWGMPKVDYAAPNVSFDATQSLAQSQNTLVNNGNNAAFVSGISANVNPSQSGHNNINFG